MSGFHDLDKLNRIKQIRELIESMPPRGEFAIRPAIEKGERLVQILFADERDARKLADSLRARQGAGVPGYQSARWFEYTPLMYRVIGSLKEKGSTRAAKAGAE